MLSLLSLFVLASTALAQDYAVFSRRSSQDGDISLASQPAANSYTTLPGSASIEGCKAACDAEAACYGYALRQNSNTLNDISCTLLGAGMATSGSYLLVGGANAIVGWRFGTAQACPAGSSYIGIRGGCKPCTNGRFTSPEGKSCRTDTSPRFAQYTRVPGDAVLDAPLADQSFEVVSLPAKFSDDCQVLCESKDCTRFFWASTTRTCFMNGTTGPQTTVVSFGASETNLVYGMAFPAGTFGQRIYSADYSTVDCPIGTTTNANGIGCITIAYPSQFAGGNFRRTRAKRLARAERELQAGTWMS